MTAASREQRFTSRCSESKVRRASSNCDKDTEPTEDTGDRNGATPCACPSAATAVERLGLLCAASCLALGADSSLCGGRGGFGLAGGSAFTTLAEALSTTSVSSVGLCNIAAPIKALEITCSCLAAGPGTSEAEAVQSTDSV